MIVIKNPIEFTIVNAVPFNSTGAFCATKVENNGESAITTIPQKKRKTSNKIWELPPIINGDIKLHKPEAANALNAIFLAPEF